MQGFISPKVKAEEEAHLNLFWYFIISFFCNEWGNALFLILLSCQFCVKFSGKTADLDITQMKATSYLQFSIANNHLNLSFLLASIRPNLYSFYSLRKKEHTASLFSFSTSFRVFFSQLCSLAHASNCSWGGQWLRTQSPSQVGPGSWDHTGVLGACKTSGLSPASFQHLQTLASFGRMTRKNENHLQALALLSRHLRIWPTENVSHISICGKVRGDTYLSPSTNVRYSVWSINICRDICFQQEALVNSYQSDELFYSPGDAYEKNDIKMLFM